ncbi:MAG: phage holin family protein [Winogradskyella sp.]
MNLIMRLLINALAVFILAHLLDGVTVNGYTGAIIVALVLSILNILVKPILIILTLPVTILTLGLFLLVINALIIGLADRLIDGFEVSSFWTAILFSVLLSLLQSVLQSVLKDNKK